MTDDIYRVYDGTRGKTQTRLQSKGTRTSAVEPEGMLYLLHEDTKQETGQTNRQRAENEGEDAATPYMGRGVS